MKTYYYYPYPYNLKALTFTERLRPDIKFLEKEIKLFKLEDYGIKIVRADRITSQVYVLFNNANVYLTREEYENIMDSYFKFSNAKASYRMSSFIYMIRKENGLL